MLFSLSSFALSLLLVFRTNQAYSRCVQCRHWCWLQHAGRTSRLALACRTWLPARHWSYLHARTLQV